MPGQGVRKSLKIGFWAYRQEGVIMAHKKIERKKEIDRRRKRLKERLKERVREAKTAAKKA